MDLDAIEGGGVMSEAPVGSAIMETMMCLGQAGLARFFDREARHRPNQPTKRVPAGRYSVSINPIGSR